MYPDTLTMARLRAEVHTIPHHWVLIHPLRASVAPHSDARHKALGPGFAHLPLRCPLPSDLTCGSSTTDPTIALAFRVSHLQDKLHIASLLRSSAGNPRSLATAPNLRAWNVPLPRDGPCGAHFSSF